MTNHLQHYFPMIRTREEVLKQIHDSRRLSARFYGWPLERRNEFLDFCAGAKGINILRGALCREILNPESAPERLEDLLSLLLRQSVRILYALPGDPMDADDPCASLTAGVVAELGNGDVVHIELLKSDGRLCGARCACDSASLLLRQRQRARKARRQYFSYEDIRPVYSIVLLEQSAALFQDFPDTYVHRFQARSDSGLELELLQRYLFVPLDVFLRDRGDKPIETRLQAWLTFFCEDRPQRIINLITAYPEFQFLYEDVYRLCRDPGDAMERFFETPYVSGHGAVQLMLDSMRETLDARTKELSAAKESLRIQAAELAFAKERLLQTDAKLQETLAQFSKAPENDASDSPAETLPAGS